MRNLKRFLAMTLTMLMVVGSFAMAGSVAAFDDVVDYQQQINLMSVLKIIEGYSADEFGPENDVERWHMALWIAKIMTGKVEDAYVNWYSTQNNTAFKDLEVDNFYGSISYCNENGVVIGTSATTFEPTKGIMIQDVFTMVVRMLGYGSSSMDSNYPWSYVDKAIQLGLDKDLAADYNNEDVATREQAAVILYNALFAKKSDGKTYAEAKFNLTIDTVVLTGTSKANMFAAGDVEGKKLAGENYVAFNQLNEDGTLGSETFYLLKSWFGFDEDYDENLYFGQSYKVISKDNFASLIYVEAVEGYAVDQTDFDGVKDSGNALKIEGKDYRAVKSFTYLNRAQGSKNTDDLEVIVYDVNNRTTVNLATSYIMDANRNILNKDGTTYLYYNADHHQTGSSDWRAPYTLKIKIDGVEVYVKPTQADWDKAYKHVQDSKTGAMRMVGSDTGFKSHDLLNVNAYSDTVLYDDNFDGIFDRAFYTYYKFGFISYNDDSHLTIDGKKIFGDVKYTDAAITYVTAEGEKLDAADVVKALDSNLSKGNYVLYTYNASNKYVTIKEFFTPNKGLVTSIDKRNGTITFDQVYYNITAGNVAGSKFNVGNAKLPGATKNEVITNIPNGDLDYLQGRNVHYIEKDGNVLAIYEAYKNAGKYLVFDSVVGINSTGYVNALVYNNNNTRSVITIASVDGDWYGFDNTTRRYYSNVDYLYDSYGELFSYTVDALGNYHVKLLNQDSDYTYYYDRAGRRGDDVSIKFINGIAVPVINRNDVDGLDEFKFFENANGVAKAFKQFNTNADTVIVIMDRNNVLHAFKGVPENNAVIDIFNRDWTESAIIFVDQTDDDKPSVAKFIYIKDAKFDNFRTRSSWDIRANDTIIFVDDDTAATEIITNQVNTGYGVTQGATYSYNKAIDFVRGGVLNNILVYNQRLTKGNFYYVKDGYVEGKVDLNGGIIKTGYLQYIDTYEAVLTYNNARVEDSNYRTNYLYKLVGTNIVNVSADDDNPKNMINTEKANINTDGAYAPVYFYDGNIDSTANVFIYESIIKGLSSSHLYERQDAINAIEVIPGKLENYQFVSATADYTVENWYEITAEDYFNLSSSNSSFWRSNDDANRIFRYVGTNVTLYNKSGAVVSDFTNSTGLNILASTRIAYTNGGGIKYLLGFKLDENVVNNVPLVGGSKTDNFTLRWTHVNGITPYSITLKGFGLKSTYVPDDPDPVYVEIDNIIINPRAFGTAGDLLYYSDETEVTAGDEVEVGKSYTFIYETPNNNVNYVRVILSYNDNSSPSYLKTITVNAAITSTANVWGFDLTIPADINTTTGNLTITVSESITGVFA